MLSRLVENITNVVFETFKSKTTLIKDVENLIKEKNYGHAKEELEKMMKENPENSKINYLMGLVLSKTGSYMESAKYLQRSIEDNDSNEKALQEISFVLYKTDNADESLDYCRKCLAINPRNLEVRHLIAKIYENEGNFSEAEFQYKECLIMFPNESKAVKLMGKFERRKNKRKSEQLEKIEQLNKNCENIQFLIAMQNDKEIIGELGPEKREKLREELAKIEKCKKEEDEDKNCVICMNNKANMVSLKCGYVCMCETCQKENKITICPLCKQKTRVGGYKKAFIP